MTAWAPVALLVLAAVQLAINLYFVGLLYPLPAPLTRLLARAAAVCGVDGGSCRRVFGTKYARIVGGVPTVLLGVPWSVALLVLGAATLATGACPLWLPAFVVSCATVPLGAYLTWVLYRVLRESCPLCLTGHAINAAVTGLLWSLR
jgi:uncharacterized membrane protein